MKCNALNYISGLNFVVPRHMWLMQDNEPIHARGIYSIYYTVNANAILWAKNYMFRFVGYMSNCKDLEFPNHA
jgi:hypothetical protein